MFDMPSWRYISEHLSDTNFELILRARLTKARASTEEIVKINAINLIETGFGTTRCWTWQISCGKAYPYTETRGEVLAVAIYEAERRQKADETNKLALIAHDADTEDAPS